MAVAYLSSSAGSCRHGTTTFHCSALPTCSMTGSTPAEKCARPTLMTCSGASLGTLGITVSMHRLSAGPSTTSQGRTLEETSTTWPTWASSKLQHKILQFPLDKANVINYISVQEFERQAPFLMVHSFTHYSWGACQQVSMLLPKNQVASAMGPLSAGESL